MTRIQKRPNGNIIGSGVVNLNYTGEPLLARIVFVKSEKQKSQWLALLSTDLTLSEDEIVTLYGKRWDGGLLQDGEIGLETGSGVSSQVL